MQYQKIYFSILFFLSLFLHGMHSEILLYNNKKSMLKDFFVNSFYYNQSDRGYNESRDTPLFILSFIMISLLSIPSIFLNCYFNNKMPEKRSASEKILLDFKSILRYKSEFIELSLIQERNPLQSSDANKGEVENKLEKYYFLFDEFKKTSTIKYIFNDFLFLFNIMTHLSVMTFCLYSFFQVVVLREGGYQVKNKPIVLNTYLYCLLCSSLISIFPESLLFFEDFVGSKDPMILNYQEEYEAVRYIKSTAMYQYDGIAKDRIKKAFNKKYPKQEESNEQIIINFFKS
jgi:hypothetical protein